MNELLQSLSVLTPSSYSSDQLRSTSSIFIYSAAQFSLKTNNSRKSSTMDFKLLCCDNFQTHYFPRTSIKHIWQEHISFLRKEYSSNADIGFCLFQKWILNPQETFSNYKQQPTQHICTLFSSGMSKGKATFPFILPGLNTQV